MSSQHSFLLSCKGKVFSACCGNKSVSVYSCNVSVMYSQLCLKTCLDTISVLVNPFHLSHYNVSCLCCPQHTNIHFLTSRGQMPSQ